MPIRLMVAIAVVFGTIACTATAWAQDTTQDTTQAPAVAEKPFTISLTPRLWYQMGNGNTYKSTPFFQATVDQTQFADYGLSVEVAAKSLPNWSFILTGYDGGGSTPSRGLEYFPSFNRFGTTVSAVSELTTADAFSRYDIEFLARYLVAPTISVTGGFRTFNFTDKQTDNVIDIFPNTNLASLSQPNIRKIDSQYYLGEIGVLFSTPFSESGRHLIFGGTTLGLGIATASTSQLNFFADGTTNNPRTWVTDFVTSLDVYVGYQFLLTQSVALNIRYRAIMYSVREFPGQVSVNHGPEFGITTRF